MPYDFKFGSQTAKGGFANEKDVVNKFNNWKSDSEAKNWLVIMGYDLKEVEDLLAVQVPVLIGANDLAKYNLSPNEIENMKFKKADIQVKIRLLIKIGGAIRFENLSLKKANDTAGYNQIDKRAVDSYKKMWGFDDDTAIALKVYSGEYPPKDYQNFLKVDLNNLKDKERRRAFLTEIKDEYVDVILTFFEKNKIKIVCDLLKGRGGLSANWMLVTKYNVPNDTTTWVLRDINEVLNFYGNGEVKISKRGSLHIGKITMQRKGGTPDPTKLQFKIDPNALFDLAGGEIDE